MLPIHMLIKYKMEFLYCLIMKEKMTMSSRVSIDI